MMSQPSIAIIGAGPSGLIFARLLELSGITDYVVYERDTSCVPGPGQQGGTLDLHVSSGQLALKRCGLHDEFNKVARWDGSCFHILNPEGKTVIQHSEPADSPSARPEIDRVQLRQLLLDSIPTQKICWGHAVKAIERSNDSDPSRDNGCVIHFTNGTSATGFKLLVGADGAWSKTRSLLSPARPLYSGKMFIEGRISQDNPAYPAAREVAGPGNVMAIGGHKMLAVQMVADRTYRTNFGLEVPEEFYQGHRDALTKDVNERSERIRQRLLSSNDLFATWDPSLKTFVENAEGPFRAWPLYYLPPEKVHWERSTALGVTVLGDAAHVTTPFVGEGVNCSMHDAVILAERIIEHCGSNISFANVKEAELERALTEYETNMFARGQDLIRRSAESEAMLFSENASEKFLEFVANRKKNVSSGAESDSQANATLTASTVSA